MFCSENWFHLQVKTFQAFPPPPKKKKKKEAGSCYLFVLFKISDEHPCSFYIHVGVPPGGRTIATPSPSFLRSTGKSNK